MDGRFILMIVLVSTILTSFFFVFSSNELILNANYFNEISIDSSNEVDAKIGIMEVNNQRYFESRVYFPNLKACIFNPRSTFTYRVYFTPAMGNIKLGKNDFRGGNNYLELPTTEITNISMRLTLEWPLLDNNLEQKLYYDSIPKKNTLYIFDINQTPMNSSISYEYCKTVDKKDAIKNITIVN